VPFEVRPADVEEIESGDAREVALENARRKAAATAGGIVLAVDTTVSLDGEMYGKPLDEDEARETLRALADRTHEVVSGIVIGGREAIAVTEVSFRDLPDGWIDWYVDTGEWRDRAGGYAIQGRGAALVKEIRGDYLNVVGLPVAALLDLAPELLAR
jgi:nucleoside triphosphate pyrophosphatase